MWRSRRETNDDGLWNAPSPSAAGATDGWLMPDADDLYELGGDGNNVEAFEAMRQQARAEWAQARDVKVCRTCSHFKFLCMPHIP